VLGTGGKIKFGQEPGFARSLRASAHARNFRLIWAVPDRVVREPFNPTIKVRTLPQEIDISSVSTRARDFSDEEVGEVLDPLLDEIGQAILQYAADRKSFLRHPNPFGVAMTKRQAGRWIQARKAELEAQYA
jgi:hypothetical protein